MPFVMKAMIPTAIMTIKAKRQPNCWPINVPKGTPVTVATVRPVNIIEIALALLSSGTISAAIVEPIDINTPCENADITRAASKIPMLEAVAAIVLPAIKINMIQSNSVLRDMLEVNEVNIGAPNVTPSA